jgi:hypothetical protein
VRLQQREQVVGGERPAPDEALVEQAGQRVHVGPQVPDVAEHALGGHVGRAADGQARPAERRAAEHRGHPEVHEVDETAVDRLLVEPADQQRVGRLDVAVHQSLGVRGVQRVGDLGHHVDHPLHPELGAAQHRGQVGALDQSHVDVELAVDLAVVVDRDDVRFAQHRGQRGLPLEPLAVLRVGDQVPGHPLHRDHPVAPGVERAEHLTHAAATDHGVQAVGPEELR